MLFINILQVLLNGIALMLLVQVVTLMIICDLSLIFRVPLFYKRAKYFFIFFLLCLYINPFIIIFLLDHCFTLCLQLTVLALPNQFSLSKRNHFFKNKISRIIPEYMTIQKLLFVTNKLQTVLLYTKNSPWGWPASFICLISFLLHLLRFGLLNSTQFSYVECCFLLPLFHTYCSIYLKYFFFHTSHH